MIAMHICIFYQIYTYKFVIHQDIHDTLFFLFFFYLENQYLDAPGRISSEHIAARPSRTC